jgi:hypothetical protein
VWYLKDPPSYITNFLDKPLNKLKRLMMISLLPSAKIHTFLLFQDLFKDEISSVTTVFIIIKLFIIKDQSTSKGPAIV